MAPPHDVRRPYKRSGTISDQQRRRDIALLRQAQLRAECQNRARFLVSSVLSLHDPQSDQQQQQPPNDAGGEGLQQGQDRAPEELDVVQASRIRGPDARKWFSRQLMLPEWMIDVPPRLHDDWYVFARPAGKRCFVVSFNGTTVSRLRNGSVLHHFPSNLPNGARIKDVYGPAQGYSILDCIFHEADQTYYVIDMVSWRGYSLYECTSEFRFFWLNSKLVESGACKPPSLYHKYRFCTVPVYDCNKAGLHSAYAGNMPYCKDGLAFYNKHAHYQAGITPLALVWKDQNCSQYLLDTNDKGEVPTQQLVALELQVDGKLTTSDEPPVVLGFLDKEHSEKFNLQHGSLLRFAIGDGGLTLLDGKLGAADLHYIGKVNRARAFADSYSKILFQYMARRSPLQFEHLLESADPSVSTDNKAEDVEMIG